MKKIILIPSLFFILIQAGPQASWAQSPQELQKISQQNQQAQQYVNRQIEYQNAQELQQQNERTKMRQQQMEMEQKSEMQQQVERLRIQQEELKAQQEQLAMQQEQLILRRQAAAGNVPSTDPVAKFKTLQKKPDTVTIAELRAAAREVVGFVGSEILSIKVVDRNLTLIELKNGMICKEYRYGRDIWYSCLDNNGDGELIDLHSSRKAIPVFKAIVNNNVSP